MREKRNVLLVEAYTEIERERERERGKFGGGMW